MKPPSDLRPGERVFALALLGVSLLAFQQAYGISGFSGLTTGGVIPMLAAGVMVVSGLVILRDALARPRPARPSLRETLRFLVPPQLVLFVALLVAYGAAIPGLGFLPASGVFLFLSIWMLWRRGVLWAAGITALSVTGVYVVFRLVFQVVLPSGTVWP
ncbi:tripartite tricarboxylate transporter TctB family protein [Rhodovulum marinum]|uniref:Tripartite tricarboxylate transporter TctB family protein n=1 Tax=Rhodovulum marinum TaxID=320662 RepID=A0A4V6NR07_9RHOB|nr:tripartite tricarboxylate transporter TctB family protein [Rhodovulum marinum]TCP41266.1 tripartite tricarboxylate transporter TctB family protein [Rhodovulum marinum]